MKSTSQSPSQTAARQRSQKDDPRPAKGISIEAMRTRLQEIGDRLIDLSERAGLLSLRLCGPESRPTSASLADPAEREKLAKALKALGSEVEAFDPNQRRGQGLRPYCHASIVEWWRSYHLIAGWLSPSGRDTRSPED